MRGKGPSIDTFRFEHYEIMGEVGEGSFAHIYLALHKETRNQVAIKVFEKQKLEDSDQLKLLKQEMSVAMQVQHPLIVPIFDFIEDEFHIAMVMEYLNGGSLLSLINKHHGLQIDFSKKLFFQLMTTIQYLHTKLKIVHRDLKAENILIDENLNIRLIDFGLARPINSNRPLQTVCGSPAYAAPELIAGTNYTAAVDLWSAGVILYAMLCGHLPFYDPNIVKLLQKVTQEKIPFPPTLDPIALDLLTRLLDKNPLTRITLEEVFLHPFLANSPQKIFDGDEFNLLPPPVDHEIIIQLEELGFSTNDIFQTVKKSFNNNVAACYKILRRKKITINMNKKEILEKPIRSTLRKGIETHSSPMISRFKNSSTDRLPRLEIRENSSPVVEDKLPVPSLNGAMGSPLAHMRVPVRRHSRSNSFDSAQKVIVPRLVQNSLIVQ